MCRRTLLLEDSKSRPLIFSLAADEKASFGPRSNKPFEGPAVQHPVEQRPVSFRLLVGKSAGLAARVLGVGLLIIHTTISHSSLARQLKVMMHNHACSVAPLHQDQAFGPGRTRTCKQIDKNVLICLLVSPSSSQRDVETSSNPVHAPLCGALRLLPTCGASNNPLNTVPGEGIPRGLGLSAAPHVRQLLGPSVAGRSASEARRTHDSD